MYDRESQCDTWWAFNGRCNYPCLVFLHRFFNCLPFFPAANSQCDLSEPFAWLLIYLRCFNFLTFTTSSPSTVHESVTLQVHQENSESPANWQKVSKEKGLPTYMSKKQHHFQLHFQPHFQFYIVTFLYSYFMSLLLFFTFLHSHFH